MDNYCKAIGGTGCNSYRQNLQKLLQSACVENSGKTLTKLIRPRKAIGVLKCKYTRFEVRGRQEI